MHTEPSKRIIIDNDSDLYFEMPEIYSTESFTDLITQLDSLKIHYLDEATKLRKKTHSPEIRKIVSDKLKEKIQVSFSLAYKICSDHYRFYSDNIKLCRVLKENIHDIFITGNLYVR